MSHINPHSHTLPQPKATLSHAKLRRLFALELLLEALRSFVLNKPSGSRLNSLAKEAETLIKGYAGNLGHAVHVAKDLAKRVAQGTLEEGIPTFVGLTLKMKDATQRDEFLQLTTDKRTEDVRRLIGKIGHDGVTFLILVDDPDELCWDAEQLMPVLGGLCAAALDVSSLPETNGVLKTCVLIKQHLFDRLRRAFENFDHIASNVLPLAWETDELRNVIARRIIHKMKLDLATEPDQAWERAFNPGTKNIGVLQTYLNERLTNGPRDLVVFCNKAMVAAQHRSSPRIEMRDIVSAEKEYSEDRLDEVEREFGEQYRSISAIVRRLFKNADLQRSTKIKRAKLEHSLEQQVLDDRQLQSMRQDERWFRDAVPATLVSILFQVGVIGYYSPENPDKRVMNWSSVSPAEGIDEAQYFFVPPAYHWALRIGEYASRNNVEG